MLNFSDNPVSGYMLENSLKIEAENYHLLVEQIKDYAIFMLDPSGIIMSWNKGAENIFGLTAEEAIGKSFSAFYTSDDVQKMLPTESLQMAKHCGHYESEGWQQRRDGSHFLANIVFTTLYDEAGNLVGFGEVSRDLSRRHQLAMEEGRMYSLNSKLEAQLQQRQVEVEDYKHALDESSIVAVTDQKGIIRHVNDNFCKISKYSREELIGQDHRIINSGYHPKTFIHSLWVTIANGRVWKGEIKNRAKDGTYYWVDTTIVPFLNEKGKPYQYLAIRSDITSKKKAEEELRQMNEQLELKIRERTFELTEALEREKELSDIKSRFVSLASHEFRTPLSTILSSTALLEHYAAPQMAEKREKHLQKIRFSVEQLTYILDDFLSLEKLEQGRMEAQYLEFDLEDFINDVADQMEGMVKKNGQTIMTTYLGEKIVRQDKKMLRNILLNLLSNAVKYSPAESEIQLLAKVGDSRINFEISDSGIGIPKEEQKELFSRFHRASNAMHIQGTGLGLHIVKRYIELLNGSIDFTSEENRGTTFFVQLPAS